MGRAALFDADGVLVDSYSAYRRIWTRWSDHQKLDPEIVWAATHARRAVDTIQLVAPHADTDREYDRLRAYMAEEGDAFPLFPAVAVTLNRLHRAQWAIVTSGRAENLRHRLRAGGAAEPKVLVDGSMVSEGKPAPDGYILAATLLGASPRDCLAIEDAPAGVIAAKSAGMRVLAITTTHDALALEAADEILASFAFAADRVHDWIDC